MLPVRARLDWSCGGLALLSAVLVGACGGGETREADESGAAVASVAQAPTPPDSTPQLRRFLPDDLRRSTRPGTFAHGAHVRIGCAVCHEAPRGHDAHGGLACAECHRASAEATLAVLSPEQCQSCHHAADQTLTCEHCHESRGALESTQTLAFGVWSAPRERALPFDHAAHVELDCASCHTTAPALSPAASCASCHDAHMEAAVRCVSCHVAPAVGTHDVDAHLTCSGAGCHSAPIVEALAGARPVCLLCHQAQTEHEPAGNCVDCHRVRPGGGATGGGS